MKAKTIPGNDIFQCIPTRTLEWKSSDDGRVILFVPKFRNRFAAKYLLPMLPKPNIHLHLDPLGSFVWQNCDGEQSVMRISRQLRTEFGALAEPAEERTSRFIRILIKERFITLHTHP